MNCYQCGSPRIKEQPMEVVSNRFPERRREFCSYVCVINFLNQHPECQQDEHCTVYRYGKQFDIGKFGRHWI